MKKSRGRLNPRPTFIRYVGLPHPDIATWDEIPDDLPRTRWYWSALIDAQMDRRAVVTVDVHGKNLGVADY